MFKVVSKYQPAGDQPLAIEKITNQLRNPRNKAVLKGVTGSGKTFTMANVIEKLGRPTLVMTHNKTLAAQLYRELKTFFPENAVEYFISYYDYYQPEAYVPSSDTYIEKDSAINEEIEMLRLRATASLLERQDVIVVASVSCIFGLGSPEDYENSVTTLKVGDQISRDQLIEKLWNMQYTRNDIDFGRSRYRVKGDVVDIYPSYSNEVTRIEFWGDAIESISKIEPVTSQVRSKISQTAIYPAKHFITARPKLEIAIEQIRQELKDQVEFFKKNNKLLEAERIQQRTLYDLEMLANMGTCNGVENYSRHLTLRSAGSRSACLIDYFPKDFLTIIDESHVTIPQIGGMFNGDRSRKQTLVDFGFRLPSALDNRPLNFTEFESMVNNILYVTATPAEYELNKTDCHVEQIIRPTGLLDPIVEIRPSAGQIQDLISETKNRVTLKERVLITTLTKKMAEDLTDYLNDANLKVRYLHSDIDALERVEILRDLRKGVFDVLVGINLLREGLDLPEVSLVIILDADKEGFLRSRRSLIQTIGRAARHSNGRAILYADKMTDSMQDAINETKRRRQIQEEYNLKNNITPQSIQKDIVDMIDRESYEDQKVVQLQEQLVEKYQPYNFKSKKERSTQIKEEMLKAAENLEFEKAAFLRDLLFGESTSDSQ